MAIHEIRESINQTPLVTDSNGVAYVERVIHLKQGYRHTVNAIDVFIDNIYATADGLDVTLGEVVITSQPMLLTDEPYSTLYQKSTPQVGIDTILYKMQFNLQGESRGITSPYQEFPNNFLGAMPTFSWYTPRLYMYVVFYNAPNVTISNVKISAYVAVDSRKSAYLPYMLGNIRERSIAQIAKISRLGRLIDSSRLTGQTFPMYLFGGARTQFMLKSNALADFYYQLDPQASETMLTTDEQRKFIAESRTMVSFDKAFGADDAGLGGVPDWISAIALKGVQSGSIREQWPPLKYNDNGNVRML